MSSYTAYTQSVGKVVLWIIVLAAIASGCTRQQASRLPTFTELPEGVHRPTLLPRLVKVLSEFEKKEHRVSDDLAHVILAVRAPKESAQETLAIIAKAVDGEWIEREDYRLLVPSATAMKETRKKSVAWIPDQIKAAKKQLKPYDAKRFKTFWHMAHDDAGTPHPELAAMDPYRRLILSALSQVDLSAFGDSDTQRLVFATKPQNSTVRPLPKAFLDSARTLKPQFDQLHTLKQK